jgi:uncharacterized protein
MELRHEFEVGSNVAETWNVLTDLERLSRCVPGVDLIEVTGDEHRGMFKVDVGLLSAFYRGAAKFETMDREERRLVLSVGGRDRNGNGNVRAIIAGTLEPSDGGTMVRLETDLTLTGNMLRLGSEAITGAAASLFAQFVENLHRTALGPPTKEAGPVVAEAADSSDSSAGETRGRNDLIGRVAGAGRSLAGRLRPIVTLVAFAVIIAEVLGRRRRAAAGKGALWPAPDRSHSLPQ